MITYINVIVYINIRYAIIYINLNYVTNWINMITDPSNEEKTKDAEIENVIYFPASDPDHVGDIWNECVISTQSCFLVYLYKYLLY